MLNHVNLLTGFLLSRPILFHPMGQTYTVYLYLEYMAASVT